MTNLTNNTKIIEEKIATIITLHPDFIKIKHENDGKKRNTKLEKIINSTLLRLGDIDLDPNKITKSKLENYLIQFDKKIAFWKRLIDKYDVDIKKGNIYNLSRRQFEFRRWQNLISLTSSHFI